MASRNFNFPQAYGSGVVFIPVQFRLITAPSLQIVDVVPPDEFSVTVDVAGGVSTGLVRVQLKDNFNEYLGSHWSMFDDATELYVKLSFINFGPQDHMRFGLLTYLLDANAQQVPTYSACDISGLIIMRNSSVKF